MLWCALPTKISHRSIWIMLSTGYLMRLSLNMNRFFAIWRVAIHLYMCYSKISMRKGTIWNISRVQDGFFDFLDLCLIITLRKNGKSIVMKFSGYDFLDLCLIITLRKNGNSIFMKFSGYAESVEPMHCDLSTITTVIPHVLETVRSQTIHSCRFTLG